MQHFAQWWSLADNLVRQGELAYIHEMLPEKGQKIQHFGESLCLHFSSRNQLYWPNMFTHKDTHFDVRWFSAFFRAIWKNTKVADTWTHSQDKHNKDKQS